MEVLSRSCALPGPGALEGPHRASHRSYFSLDLLRSGYPFRESSSHRPEAIRSSPLCRDGAPGPSHEPHGVRELRMRSMRAQSTCSCSRTFPGSHYAFGGERKRLFLHAGSTLSSPEGTEAPPGPSNALCRYPGNGSGVYEPEHPYVT
ncbi:hypothetical protein K439DRAFT_846839 [Ramaria rubella]|nr:hypothetical protein K439DRAFT_846839 [Ramaria rubella]